MKMLYLKTKPTPGGRWRRTLELCLLVALLTHDARALPRPQLLTHSVEVADVSSISNTFLHPRRTAAQVADIAVERPHIGVVVDWQSVCKHLCSSNLGGSGCGFPCDGSFIAPQQNWVGNDILSGCPFLCSIRLGGSRCKCPPVLTDDIYNVSPTAQNEVCQLGCTTGNQLNGCSECPDRSLVVGVDPSNNDVSSDYDNVTAGAGVATEPSDGRDDTTTDPMDSDDGDVDATSDVTADAGVATEPSVGRDDITTDPMDVGDGDVDATSDASDTTDPSGEPTALVSDRPSTITEAESTTTTTTAAPSTTTTMTTTTTQKTTTTPDWKELCQNLCRIGEGGALCNCDLPPFF